MTLLKDDKTIPIKKELNDIGLGIKDGWNFGIGFGLAIIVAMPIILMSLGLIIMIVIVIFNSLGVLL